VKCQKCPLGPHVSSISYLSSPLPAHMSLPTGRRPCPHRRRRRQRQATAAPRPSGGPPTVVRDGAAAAAPSPRCLATPTPAPALPPAVGRRERAVAPAPHPQRRRRATHRHRRSRRRPSLIPIAESRHRCGAVAGAACRPARRWLADPAARSGAVADDDDDGDEFEEEEDARSSCAASAPAARAPLLPRPFGPNCTVTSMADAGRHRIVATTVPLAV
jgi:hypothetical protein